MDIISSNAVIISGLILLIAYIFIALEKIPKVTVALMGNRVICVFHLSYRGIVDFRLFYRYNNQKCRR